MVARVGFGHTDFRLLAQETSSFFMWISKHSTLGPAISGLSVESLSLRFDNLCDFFGHFKKGKMASVF